MDIFLSVNNSADVMQIPVLPESISVSKEYSVEEFTVDNARDLALIGKQKLKGFSWRSFFPRNEYPFIRGSYVDGFDFVYRIDKWIEQKLPIRLIITGTSINQAVTVAKFDYELDKVGDVVYTIELKEVNLV